MVGYVISTVQVQLGPHFGQPEDYVVDILFLN